MFCHLYRVLSIRIKNPASYNFSTTLPPQFKPVLQAKAVRAGIVLINQLSKDCVVEPLLHQLNWIYSEESFFAAHGSYEKSQ